MIIKAFVGFLLLSINLVLCEDDTPTKADADAAAVVSSVLFAPVPTPLIRAYMVAPEFNANNEQKVACHNYRTEFHKNMRGWQVENSMQDTYDIDETGIKLNLLPPNQYIRLQDQKSKY